MSVTVIGGEALYYELYTSSKYCYYPHKSKYFLTNLFMKFISKFYAYQAKTLVKAYEKAINLIKIPANGYVLALVLSVILEY
jgi:hypothetical protein